MISYNCLDRSEFLTILTNIAEAWETKRPSGALALEGINEFLGTYKSVPVVVESAFEAAKLEAQLIRQAFGATMATGSGRWFVFTNAPDNEIAYAKLQISIPE